jgi:hypothetical protein
MTTLDDLSIDAADTARGLEVFRREGVVVVKGLLPVPLVEKTAGFLRAELDRLDGLFQRYGISKDDAAAPAELAALMERPADQVPDKDKHIFLGHFPLEVRLADTLRDIPRFVARHPLLFELLATERLFAHMPPTARFVIPHCSLARVPPHQDISYNRHMGDFCVMWVPLVPIDRKCCSMAIYPRTQGLGELLADIGPSSASEWLPPIEGSAYGQAERVILEPLALGDAVVFGPRTVHESMPNVSDRVRLSCDFRFFGEQVRSGKHFLDLARDTVVAPRPAGA